MSPRNWRRTCQTKTGQGLVCCLSAVDTALTLYARHRLRKFPQQSPDCPDETRALVVHLTTLDEELDGELPAPIPNSDEMGVVGGKQVLDLVDHAPPARVVERGRPRVVHDTEGGRVLLNQELDGPETRALHERPVDCRPTLLVGLRGLPELADDLHLALKIPGDATLTRFDGQWGLVIAALDVYCVGICVEEDLCHVETPVKVAQKVQCKLAMVTGPSGVQRLHLPFRRVLVHSQKKLYYFDLVPPEVALYRLVNGQIPRSLGVGENRLRILLVQELDRVEPTHKACAVDRQAAPQLAALRDNRFGASVDEDFAESRRLAPGRLVKRDASVTTEPHEISF